MKPLLNNRSIDPKMDLSLFHLKRSTTGGVAGNSILGHQLRYHGRIDLHNLTACKHIPPFLSKLQILADSV